MRARDPFFVVGCPRSGTTLLSVMLDRHSRVCVPPETGYFLELAPRLWCRTRTIGLRSLLQGWPRLGELALDADAVMQRLPSHGSLERSLLSTILALYAEREDKPRTGEKTPAHLLRVPRIARQFRDARIICLLRDGREASLSLAAMPWYGGSLRDAAALWRRSVRLMERFSRQYSDRFLVVRYEDLVRAPERALPDIMRFLGERFEPTQLEAGLPSRSVLSRSLAWKGGALQKIDADAIGRRQREASSEEAALLERVLQGELMRCGYVQA